MKGIILAGGVGSRLFPSTLTISKQLLPIYDKPMIYYPLSILMLAKIQEILIITTERDINNFKNLFSNGKSLGLNIDYMIQEEPEGIPQAFILGKEFIGHDSVCLVLGDNILYGDGLISLLENSKRFVQSEKKDKIFGYKVSNPEDFGVLELDSQNNVISIEEKPSKPKSKIASIGLYFYPNNVIGEAEKLNKSKRGELEITSLNKLYLKNSNLHSEILGRGYAWLDTGTPESLLSASEFVKTIEKRQGYKIACIEEISFKNGWINEDQLKKIAHSMNNSEYGKYVLSVPDE